MVIKHGYDEFFVHNSESCIGSYGPCNPSRTPKLLAITQENDHKTRNRQLFRHTSQTCIRPYGCCKLPWNPKTMVNNSWKRPQKAKRRIFIIPLKYVNRLGTLKLRAITHANGQKTL